MATQKEMEELLVKISEGAKEAKSTLAELHSERKALEQLRKSIRSELKSAVDIEVEQAMAELSKKTTDDMSDLMIGVISRLEHDWREKLGL